MNDADPPRIDPAQAQHQGRRETQQDACGFWAAADEAAAAHAGHLAVLADGMGGGHNGQWAAEQAVQRFIATYQTKAADESVPAALQRAMVAANATVYDEAQRLGAVDRMGTTLAAAVVLGQQLHWLNVGDSRVYLLQDGRLQGLSTDHSYAEVLRIRVRRGELSAGEALGHPLRHALTSYLGRPEPLQHGASVDPVVLQPGSWVLLCSDGLTQALDDGQIGAQLCGSAQQACHRLLQAALDRALPDQDNVTAAVLHLPQPGEQPDAGTISRAVYELPPIVKPPRPAPAPAVPARPRWREPLALVGLVAAVGAAWLTWLAWPAGKPATPAAAGRAGPVVDLLAPAASSAGRP